MTERPGRHCGDPSGHGPHLWFTHASQNPYWSCPGVLPVGHVGPWTERPERPETPPAGAPEAVPGVSIANRDALRGFTLSHEIDGITVNCDECGMSTDPEYGLALLDVVRDALIHAGRCTG
jgi:hypothetical protein